MTQFDSSPSPPPPRSFPSSPSATNGDGNGDAGAEPTGDPMGPKLARYVFERESCPAEIVAEVETALAQSTHCQQLAQHLRTLGHLSQRALPAEETWTDLWPAIAKKLRAAAARTAPTAPTFAATAESTAATAPTHAFDDATTSPSSSSRKPAMGIRFKCDSCSKKYEVTDKHAGRKMKCSKCAAVLVVPMQSTIDANGAPIASGIAPPTAAKPAAAVASFPAKPAATPRNAVDPVDAHDTAKVAVEADPEKTVVAGGGLPMIDAVYAPPRATAPSGRSAASPSRPVSAAPSPTKPARPSTVPPSASSAAAVVPAASAVAPTEKKKKKGQKSAAAVGATGPMAILSQLTKPNTVPGMIAASVAAVLGIVAIVMLGSVFNSGAAPTDPMADAGGTKSPITIIRATAADDDGTDDEYTPRPEGPRPLSIDCEFPRFGMAYQDTYVKLAATGGVPPYRWSVASGSQLPEGLALNGDVISGFVSEPGEFRFGIAVADDAGNHQQFSVDWVCDPKFEINVAAFPENPVAKKDYAHQFEAVGGKGPYRWEALELNLPEGLQFDSAQAVMFGNTDRRGRYSLRLAAIDNRGRRDEVRFRIEIQEGEEAIDLWGGGSSGGQGQGQNPGQPGGGNMRRPANPPGGQAQDEQGAVGWQTRRNREQLEQISRLNNEGCELMRQNKLDEAVKKFEEMLAIDSRNATALYNLACAYALGNELDVAMDYLQRAIHAGFTDFDHIQRDTDLNNLREYPAFVELTRSRSKIEDAAADGKLLELQRQFPKYLCTIDRENKFIFATNQSPEVLEMLKARINNLAQAQWRDIFEHRPDYYIVVVLPSREDFAVLRPAPNIGGWYDPSQRLLISGSIGHTLTHEFMHALHFGDIMKRGQAHQIWFLEGIATVFEDSKLPQTSEEKAVPVHNARLASVQNALRSNKYKKWAELFRMDQQQFMADNERALISYGTSRYICYWLHEQGKLSEYYNLYCQTFHQGRDGRAGIRAMEQLFGKKLDEIEADWLRWVQALPAFRAESNIKLGVSLDPTPLSTGLRVAGVQANSSAARAGMQTGDIIVEIDGRSIDSRHNLAGALSEYGPGDVARITIIRDVTDPATGATTSIPKVIAVRLTN